jgi:hypothetical protein
MSRRLGKPQEEVRMPLSRGLYGMILARKSKGAEATVREALDARLHRAALIADTAISVIDGGNALRKREVLRSGTPALRANAGAMITVHALSDRIRGPRHCQRQLAGV